MPVQVQRQCMQSQIPSLLLLCYISCKKEIEMPIMPSSLLNHPSVHSLKVVDLMQALLLDSTTAHLWAERRLFMRQLDERSALAALLKAADASEPAAVSRFGSLVKVIRQRTKQRSLSVAKGFLMSNVQPYMSADAQACWLGLHALNGCDASSHLPEQQTCSSPLHTILACQQNPTASMYSMTISALFGVRAS